MNSTNNDFYKNAALKVFAQLGQLIEEDENITNKTNDKPIKSNKLDLNNDVLNIIGDCVKQDNLDRLLNQNIMEYIDIKMKTERYI